MLKIAVTLEQSIGKTDDLARAMSIEAKLLHLQAIQNLLAPYRYLYCVDLEATCDEVGESESPRRLAVLPDQMETIEIGLVVIDLETLEIVDEFQRFVRPQINPILTEFCKELTSIQQADVDNAGTYVEVGQELAAFIAGYPDAAWASWGDYDSSQSWNEIYHGLMAVEIDGGQLTLFNDCDTLDYCEYCRSPDGRVGTLELWQRDEADPFELLSAWEREQLERLLAVL